MSSMIQSFLNERAISKLVPERDHEIERITSLIMQLKATQKELKDRREGLAYRRMKNKQREEAAKKLDSSPKRLVAHDKTQRSFHQVTQESMMTIKRQGSVDLDSARNSNGLNMSSNGDSN